MRMRSFNCALNYCNFKLFNILNILILILNIYNFKHFKFVPAPEINTRTRKSYRSSVIYMKTRDIELLYLAFSMELSSRINRTDPKLEHLQG